MNSLREGRRDAPLEAHVAAVAIGQAAPQLHGIELRKHLNKVLDDHVDVDDQRRVSIKRRRFNVGSKQAAVTVKDIWPPE